MKKVAIVGFAPSWKLAPFQDNSFEIWGLNELYQNIPAADRWFELHNREVFANSHRNTNHLQWLQGAEIPIYMQKHFDDIPNSVEYPREKIIAKFGRYFTNSISWMMALAIHEGFEEIHVYGVDMALDSEYGFQRPSCEYFIGVARGMGIKVHVPDTSDLLKHTHLYGFESESPQKKKIIDRINQLKEQLSALQSQKQQIQTAIDQITGAIDDSEYYLRVWS